MPTLEESVGYMDVSEMTQLDIPALGYGPSTPPVYPDAPNALLRSPLPPVLTSVASPDVQRQFYNRSVPQTRIFPLQAAASAAMNSGSQSQSANSSGSAVPLSIVAGANKANKAITAAPGNDVIASSSFVDLPVDSQNTPATGMVLNQSGTTTAIFMSSGTMRFGSGVRSYNFSSVNPGSYGTWLVYFDDPFYLGGSIILQATQSAAVILSAPGRIYAGSITTSGGGGGTGGGGGGISGGGGKFHS